MEKGHKITKYYSAFVHVYLLGVQMLIRLIEGYRRCRDKVKLGYLKKKA